MVPGVGSSTDAAMPAGRLPAPMTNTRKHRFSAGGGFGDPYAGFSIDADTDGDPFRIDPADSHALADLLAPENYVPADVDADALLDVGLGYLAVEQYESAVDAFARVAWFAPATTAATEAWVNRGVAHGRLGEYDEAVGAYLEALSLDPAPDVAAVAETNLAYALWASGDSSRPLEHAERAVELDPRLAEAWFNLGFLYNERGLSEAAVRALERAERLGFERRAAGDEIDLARDRLAEREGAGSDRETTDGRRTAPEREPSDGVRETGPGRGEEPGPAVDAHPSPDRERLGA